MKSRKQATNCSAGIRAGQILIFLAPLLVVASLLILFARPSNKREPNTVPAAAATFDNPLGLVLKKFPNSSSGSVRAEMLNVGSID
jgi:hypothetical protein